MTLRIAAWGLMVYETGKTEKGRCVVGRLAGLY